MTEPARTYAVYDSPFGEGWVMYEEDGPVEIGLPGRALPGGAAVVQPPAPIAELCERLSAAWKGTHVFAPDDGLATKAGTTPLTVEIYRIVSRIPAGETMTYGEVAAAAGHPGAARAVGAAMARNPFPVVIPCHRVLASGGGLGGYGGGLDQKRHLLATEGRLTMAGLEPETMGDG